MEVLLSRVTQPKVCQFCWRNFRQSKQYTYLTEHHLPERTLCLTRSLSVSASRIRSLDDWILGGGGKVGRLGSPTSRPKVLPRKPAWLTSQKYTEIQSHRFISSTSSQQNKSSYDEEEVQKFSDLAQTWWDEGGEFAALHTMNQLRVPLIRDTLLKQKPILENAEAPTRQSRPLEGLNILEIGCGGGILSEPLARLGGTVTGMDASEEGIQVAEWHALLDSQLASHLTYRCGLVEDLLGTHSGYYDAVVASEVLEHVADKSTFVSVCTSLVKPGGSIFFTTLNKTNLSYALAVVAAEQIFRIVPAGAHDWNKFLSPKDLEHMLEQNGMDTRLVHGMTINPCNLKWCWITDTSINYALHAVKPTVDETNNPAGSST